ncbi:hypothetical protein [Streptomyces sp. PRh5]|nr:hypothetical protein [Streptomyces sp. PRh5]
MSTTEQGGPEQARDEHTAWTPDRIAQGLRNQAKTAPSKAAAELVR